MRVQYLVFALCALACVIAHVAIIAAAVRPARVPSEPAVPRPNRAAEILWALVPAIALALILTATWSRVRENTRAPAAVLSDVSR